MTLSTDGQACTASQQTPRDQTGVRATFHCFNGVFINLFYTVRVCVCFEGRGGGGEGDVQYDVQRATYTKSHPFVNSRHTKLGGRHHEQRLRTIIKKVNECEPGLIEWATRANSPPR